MILLPAIDLYEKKVVRLTRGDYAQMTVYNDDPVAQAKLFRMPERSGSTPWTWRGPRTAPPQLLGH